MAADPRTSTLALFLAEALVAKAHTICPYSKATRNNIEVKLLANGKPVAGG